MPDILIRGMDMPRVGCVIAICANGDVIDTQDNVLGHAVELPPHGELIDRDALLEIGSDLWVVYDEGSGVDEAFGFSNDVILNAPVVVPEERREEA